jgi:hypothetical protein
MIIAWEYLESQSRWKNLSTQYPAFVATLPNLTLVLKRVFERDIECPDFQKQFPVHGLGRLCVEDFLELLYLCEGGFGYAAVKILRGLYERVATAAYIASDPGEAQNFHDWYFVQWKRNIEALARLHGGEYRSPHHDANMAAYERIKGRFDITKCAACKTPKQMGWTKLSLDALARKVSQIWHERFGTKGENQLQRAYLLLATLPNIQIHASMASIYHRFPIDESNTITFKTDQSNEIDHALSFGHTLIAIAADTENHFFGLGLDQEVEDLRRDIQQVWTHSTVSEQPINLDV